GRSITVSWTRSPLDAGDATAFKGYQILRSEQPGGPFSEAGFVIGGKTQYQDNVDEGKPYYYRLRQLAATDSSESEVIGPVRATAQWFDRSRVNVLVLTVILSFLLIWYIERAKKGEELFIRKIQGLDAIDEAVGRSTELGKPILYSFGLGEIRDIVTVASLAILRQVAVKCAQHGTELLVPNWDPLVMAAAQETVQQAYSEPGRPDLYKEGNVSFLTSDQFGYAAGVDGMMLRQKPGAVFFLGYFYAEALLMSETGHSVGAIQIAGTTAITQLPFFIASCDYTLIGEEMLAASCYLKRDPQLLGSLKGEDFVKAVLIWGFAAMAVLGTVGMLMARGGHAWLGGVFQAIQNWFVTA
ncbi:MAG TPA: fibronectin type III domain-containing protein, partial [Candidatus Edwardsbacteria bacterium]|nr:fibronectin type III domain-containing protein [Candidatus Edwardsbacteria bacterium]